RITTCLTSWMVPVSTAAGIASARWIDAGSMAAADRAPMAPADLRRKSRRFALRGARSPAAGGKGLFMEVLRLEGERWTRLAAAAAGSGRAAQLRRGGFRRFGLLHRRIVIVVAAAAAGGQQTEQQAGRQRGPGAGRRRIHHGSSCSGSRRWMAA